MTVYWWVYFPVPRVGRRPTCVGPPRAHIWPHSMHGVSHCGADRNSNRSRGSATRESTSLTSLLVKGENKTEHHLHTRACSPAGFIAVREMSGRNKISQGQEIVREFYRVSGKFWHLAKLIKKVMEFQTMSGKMTILDNMTLQSPCILTN